MRKVFGLEKLSGEFTFLPRREAAVKGLRLLPFRQAMIAQAEVRGRLKAAFAAESKISLKAHGAAAPVEGLFRRVVQKPFSIALPLKGRDNAEGAMVRMSSLPPPSSRISALTKTVCPMSKPSFSMTRSRSGTKSGCSHMVWRT